MFTSSDEQTILHYPHNNKPMLAMEGKWIKSNVEVAPLCPRCASPNTKFCYYNNYSLLQPRYCCKGSTRYWTKGGSLRKVPIGGGFRKNKRSTKGVDNKANSPWRSGNNSYNCDLTGSHSACNSSSSSLSPTPSGGIDLIGAYDQHQQGGIKHGDIELAAVFAKFLNQDSSLEAKFHGQDLVNESHSITPDTQLTDSKKQLQNPAASIPWFDQPFEGDWSTEVLLGEDQPQNLQLQEGEGMNREVVEFIDASGSFGLPSDNNGMLRIDAHHLWMEADNLCWQLPMAQSLQDFDLFSISSWRFQPSS